MHRPTIYISKEEKQIPDSKFKSLQALERYKRLCLWLPVRIITGNVPWGYVRPSADADEAIPDEKAIAVFKKAFYYLKNHSYEEVAIWMGSCGFPLSTSGLKDLVKNRPLWPEIDLKYEERLKL